MNAPLREIQRGLIAAVDGQGVDLPIAWFAGDSSRAGLAVSAHATTIRHARADALGDSFPKTLEELGPLFPQCARLYLEGLRPTRLMLQELGEGFAEKLLELGHSRAAELANVEWAALGAYYAADAQPLQWARIAEAADPLQLMLALHPATRIAAASGHVLTSFGVEVAKSNWVLVSRPHADVLLRPLGDAGAALARELGGGRLLGEATAAAMSAGPYDQADAAAGFTALVESGALIDGEI